MKYYLLSSGVGIAMLAVGFFSGSYFEKRNHIDSTITETRVKSNFTFVNPLLECDNSLVSPDNNMDRLRNIIRQQIDLNTTSVYYRDMNNGPWFGLSEKEKFSPASLIKVPLMMAYLKKAETDPSILDKELLNTITYDPRVQNIQPEVTLAPNQKYKIRDLIEQMIIYSDDISYELLNNYITYPELIKVYNDLGVDISEAQSNPNGNILTVKAYASFFRILFNASYLNPEMSEYGLKILSRSQFQDGLIAGIPKDISVAHKFGERQYLDTGLKQLHDCGIVYLPGKPYLLCIMTRGDDFDVLKTSIKRVSQTVYDYVSKK